MAQATMKEGFCVGIVPNWAIAQKARNGLFNLAHIDAKLITREGETYHLITYQRLNREDRIGATALVQGIIYAMR